MVRFAEVRMGDAPGLACIRCRPAPSSAAFREFDDLLAEIRRAASEWKEPLGPNVVLLGPEPFSHPSLPAIVRGCVDAGFSRIALETDAVALGVRPNAAGSIAVGVRVLRVRMLAGQPALGDELAGAPGHTERAFTGIAAFRSAAADAGVRTAIRGVIPVCVHNLDAVPETVAALAEAGASSVELHAQGSPPSRAAAILAAACDTGVVNRTWVEVLGVDLPPSHALHVAEVLEGV
jgi:hypothetical protein